jgi:hypothetical protein
MAQIAMTYARSQQKQIGAVIKIRDQMSRNRPPGFGDWVDVLQGSAGLPNTSDAGLGLVADFWRDEEVRNAIGRLSKRRNDQAHQRRVEADGAAVAIQDARADITAIGKAADFLADMPLRLVDAALWDTFEKVTSVRYRELMGDHWVVNSESARLQRDGIEANSVYIVDPNGHWHLVACP